MVFMHLLRYVLEKPNMKPWNKFDVKDYKLNVRAVTRYTCLDEQIIQASSLFKKLPDKLGGGSDPSELARIKRRCNNIYTSENETESPLKKRFVVGDISSDEEEFQMQEGQMKEGQMQEDQMQEDQMQEGQIQEGQMQESQIQID